MEQYAGRDRTLMRASWTFSFWSYSRCAAVATEKASLSCCRVPMSLKALFTTSSVSCKQPPGPDQHEPPLDKHHQAQQASTSL